MKDIIFAGNLIVDHIKVIEALPPRGELAKILAVSHSTGGCVCNTGIDLSILDPQLSIGAAGLIGQDGDGDMLLATLEQQGIDTSLVQRRGVTSFTDVLAERSTGCRTFVQFGGACAEFDIDDLPVDDLDCKLIHIGYLLLMDKLDSPDPEYGTRLARLLHALQSKGIQTSVDVVSEDSDRFLQVVPPALKYLDYLTINEIEAGKTAGIPLRDEQGNLLRENLRPALEKLLGMGVGQRVIVHCPEGAFGMDRRGHYAWEAVKPLPEGYIKGTVGAGDAFCAGVLLASLRNLPLEDALVYGNAAARVSLRSASASGSMCPMDEALLEYRG